MKKVSIIIPVYNIEKYIKECIDSVLAQSYENLEIILVNDGSTDKSRNICELYQNIPNIILYSQKNQGVSSARNKGIELSTGEYILFVDSDDYIETNFVQKMVDAIHENDIAVCGYVDKYVKKSFNHIVSHKEIIINSKEMLKRLFDTNKSGGYIFNKIFKSSIIKNNNLKFNEDIYMCEDLLFVTEYLSYCKKSKLLSDVLYNYRMRSSSAVWNRNEKYLTIFAAYKLINVQFQKQNIDNNVVIYSLLISYFFLKNKQKKMVTKKYSLPLKKYYISIIRNKEISKRKKIKLFILKNFKWVYYIYLKVKINAYIRYE